MRYVTATPAGYTTADLTRSHPRLSEIARPLDRSVELLSTARPLFARVLDPTKRDACARFASEMRSKIDSLAVEAAALERLARGGA